MNKDQDLGSNDRPGSRLVSLFDSIHKKTRSEIEQVCGMLANV